MQWKCLIFNINIEHFLKPVATEIGILCNILNSNSNRMFFITQIINTKYFSIQDWMIGLYKGDGPCSL